MDLCLANSIVKSFVSRDPGSLCLSYMDSGSIRSEAEVQRKHCKV